MHWSYVFFALSHQYVFGVLHLRWLSHLPGASELICHMLTGFTIAWCLPDSKAHGANMGPTWGRQAPGGPHVGPMNLAIWVFKKYNSRHRWDELLKTLKQYHKLPVICIPCVKPYCFLDTSFRLTTKLIYSFHSWPYGQFTSDHWIAFSKSQYDVKSVSIMTGQFTFGAYHLKHKNF